MNGLNRHWDSIFTTTDDSKMGWYEGDVAQTVKFLDLIPAIDAPMVFLPGAGTSVLVDELLGKGYRLILNDISGKALDSLKDRTGSKDELTWLHHDISQPVPAGIPVADVWIDRAVLHFLREEVDIKGYFDNVRNGLRPGGHVLLAEFSTNGAARCAGLDLHRYSVEEMTERLGTDFELVAHEEYIYTNPFGDERPYVYALYKRCSV